MEHGHHSTVLHLAIFDYQIEEKPLYGRSLVDSVEMVLFHHLGYRKERPRIKPA